MNHASPAAEGHVIGGFLNRWLPQMPARRWIIGLAVLCVVISLVVVAASMSR